MDAASGLFSNFLLMHKFFQMLLHLGVPMETITEIKLSAVVEHGRLLATMKSAYGAVAALDKSCRVAAAAQVLQRCQPSFFVQFAWHSLVSLGRCRHCFVPARGFQQRQSAAEALTRATCARSCLLWWSTCWWQRASSQSHLCCFASGPAAGGHASRSKPTASLTSAVLPVALQLVDMLVAARQYPVLPRLSCQWPPQLR